MVEPQVGSATKFRQYPNATTLIFTTVQRSVSANADTPSQAAFPIHLSRPFPIRVIREICGFHSLNHQLNPDAEVIWAKTPMKTLMKWRSAEISVTCCLCRAT
jgi:hypothetical protein